MKKGYELTNGYLDYLEKEVDDYMQDHTYLPGTLIFGVYSYWYNLVEFLSNCKGDEAHDLRVKIIKLVK